jgi:hypothetical protein
MKSGETMETVGSAGYRPGIRVRHTGWLVLMLVAIGCGKDSVASDTDGSKGAAPDAHVDDKADASHAHASHDGGSDSGASDHDDAGDARDAQCDLNGIWIARLTTFSRDSVFSATQTASNWFYYEIDQSGVDFSVSREIDCGIQVSGSADVTINSATTKALLHRNDQTGRRGRFSKEGKLCSFELDRFYSTRGLDRAKYLPADTSDNPDLSSLKPALPTEQSPDGAEDWDDDGQPGIGFNVSGLGSRHVVQRDWNEASSDADHPIALDGDEFVAAARFDNQEEILAVSGGLGDLIRAGSTPALDIAPRMTFRRLGRSANEAAVRALQGKDDLATCYNVQAALPHDSAMK